MDTDAILAAARQLRFEAETRDAEAIRVGRLYSELRDAAYDAEISRKDIADPKILKKKARAWQRQGKAMIACGLDQYIDDMPETDGPLKLCQAFVKHLAKLICEKKSSLMKITEHLRTIAEFDSVMQGSLCQRTWNDLIPVLQAIEIDRKEVSSMSDGSVEAGNDALKPQLENGAPPKAELSALRKAIAGAGGKTATVTAVKNQLGEAMQNAKIYSGLRYLEGHGEYRGFARRPRKPH